MRGTVTSFAVNGRPTEAFGINGADSAVGYFINAQANAFHGFLRDNTGHYTQIDFPGSTSTACTSINDTGVITGFYVDTAGARTMASFWPMAPIRAATYRTSRR